MRRYGQIFIIALLVIAVDQASKLSLVGMLTEMPYPFIEVTSFFNLVMVWNHGVSFGLFSAMNAKWFLIGVSCIICGLLLYWGGTTNSKARKSCYGFIIGGAIGNVIDRLHYGAVADFFDFHVAGWHYPAFNVADMSIVCGVIVLMYLELKKN